jgi:hypothetical protein
MASQDSVMADVQQTPFPSLPTIHSTQPLSSTNPETYVPPRNPSLTTENICLWDDRETMDFLERMQINEDDVVSIGIHKWGCFDGPPDKLGFDGKSMLQLEREHILDDETLKLEDAQRMWNVIRQTQNFARRNDRIIADRLAAEENERRDHGAGNSDFPDSDPILAPMSRKARGKRPMYEVSDDEDFDGDDSMNLDLESEGKSSSLSDVGMSEESDDIYDE